VADCPAVDSSFLIRAVGPHITIGHGNPGPITRCG